MKRLFKIDKISSKKKARKKNQLARIPREMPGAPLKLNKSDISKGRACTMKNINRKILSKIKNQTRQKNSLKASLLQPITVRITSTGRCRARVYASATRPDCCWKPFSGRCFPSALPLTAWVWKEQVFDPLRRCFLPAPQRYGTFFFEAHSHCNWSLVT